MKLKNEVMVGVVVVVGIIIAVIGAFWLSGTPFGAEQRPLRAVFGEVGELRSGNPVKFRGVQVGRVDEIDVDPTGLGVRVTMQLDDPDFVLPPDPGVVLAPASLFGDWQAEIVSTTDANFAQLDFIQPGSEDVLPGAAMPDITELTAVGSQIADNLESLSRNVEIAFTEQTALQIQQMVQDASMMVEQMTGFVDQQTQTYRDVSQNVLVATEEVAVTTARLGQVATNVEAAFNQGGRVDQILSNAQEASANLQQLSVQLAATVEGVPGMVARADTTVAALGDLASSASVLLDTLEPQVQELGPAISEARVTLATLQRAAAGIEQGDGTLGRMLHDPALYEEMQATITTLRRLLADVQANPGRFIGEIF
jgi:phospholipid/cholesterol/gamma-HCH transport system substrate-binding protein